MFDEERAPFVKLAFELYATGDMVVGGTARRADRARSADTGWPVPGGPVSISKLAELLRDPYYIGYVTLQG